MKNVKNSTIVTLFAFFLVFSMIASIVLLPTIDAHKPAWQIKTYSFCNVSPNPIGIGQTVNVNFWLDIPPPTASGAYGDRWTNMTVVVTHPDGTSETLGPFISDDTGGSHATYTPNVIGNYTFQMIFKGETLLGLNTANGLPSTNVAVGDYFQPSQSNLFTLVVQQEPISYPPSSPFPSNYWTRPIYATNNNWYTIGGNWLGLGVSTFANTGMYNASRNYNAYTTAPNSAHILWTKPIAFGGTVGGEYGGSEQSNYWSTSQYQPKFAPIIMQDVLYYTMFPGSTANPAGWAAVNLHTGQTIWTKTNTTAILRCGQINNYLTPNEYGARAYLWATGSLSGVPSTGTTYSMYDAMTGSYVLSIINATSVSPMVLDDHGFLTGYYINATGNQRLLTLWNATRAIMRGPTGTGDPNGWQWRPTQDAQIPFSYGVEWAQPIATNISGNDLPANLAIVGAESGVVLLTAVSPTGGSFFNSGYEIDAGYSASTGQQLWIANNTRVPFTLLGTGGDYYLGDGYYCYFEPGALKLSAFNLLTGKTAWAHVLPNTSPYDSLGGRGIIANHTIYLWTYGGNVYAYNLDNGNLIWQYQAPSGGLESPYGTQPLWVFMVGTIADGKLYVPEGHMYSPPLFRNARQLALNLTDGSIVWSISAFDVTSGPAIVDGVMTTLNAYDNQLYAWGKGPSATTVSAPNLGVTTATPITITGTVTDISAGTKQEAPAANFPYGVPCVSEASQSQFMEAVYMQQPMPTNTTGVQVTISVADSNGNTREIGTTTTNSMGVYGFSWTPDIRGSYSLIVRFAGSESYFGSSASTYFYASEAPTPPPTTITQASTVTMGDILPYLAASVIAIIVAIAIVGLIILKKRP